MLSHRLRSVTSLRWNLFSNLLGNVWTALLAFALLPVIIRFLGVQQYGLIGFFTSLQALVILLDAGMSTTLNRWLARLRVRSDSAQEMRDTLRSLEIPYWAIAVLVGILSLLVSPVFGRDWFRGSTLSASTLQQAMFLMGLSIAVQFPFALYSGGLLGVQRQVLLNVVTVIVSTVRSVGGVLVLWLVSPTIQAFLLWQVGTSLALSVVTGVILWWVLPHSAGPARFTFAVVRNVWRFAAGISTITIEALILTQVPRLLVSRIIPLTEFGYLSVATALATALSLIAGPITSAFFPQFSELIELRQLRTLSVLYHKGCQVMTVLLIPAGTVIVVFSPHVLFAWTGSPAIVHGSQTLLALMTIGTVLNMLMWFPYNLQLADGWTKLTIYENLVMIVLILPGTLVLTYRYGATGSALMWIAVNAVYVFIGIPLMHRRLLPGEMWRWYAADVGPGVLASVTVSLILLRMLAFGGSRIETMVQLSLVALVVLGATFLAMPVTREFLTDRIKDRRSPRPGSLA
jgi:O-antigen/teichoic acid export membrane protein